VAFQYPAQAGATVIIFVAVVHRYAAGKAAFGPPAF
jgi:hypothetical protein